MFENTIIRGIHKSRYIASWIKSGGGSDRWGFEEWLETLIIDNEHLSEDEIQQICNYAFCGKLELELSAKKFIAKSQKGS